MKKGGYALKHTLKKIVVLLVFPFFLFCAAKPSLCQPSPNQENFIQVLVGEPTLVPVNGIKRFLILDPEILSGRIVSADKLELTGIKRADTLVHIWDNDGLHTLRIKVEIKEIKMAQEKINKQAQEARQIPSLKLDYYYDYQEHKYAKGN